MAQQTAKEKAEELVNKMWNIEERFGSLGNHEAKQCALVAVDETIRTLNEDIRDLDVRGNILLDLIEYWREVKQEIEKL